MDIELKFDFEELKEAVFKLSQLFNDKRYADNMKNIVLWYNQGEIKLAAVTILTTGYLQLKNVEIESKEELSDEFIVQIYAKELMTIITMYSNLAKTEVSQFKIKITDETIKCVVTEEPKEDIKTLKVTTQSYNLQRLIFEEKNKLKELHLYEDYDYNLKEYESEELLEYLNALIPTINQETLSSMYARIFFSTEYIYTAPEQFMALMKNSLDEKQKGFMLDSACSLCVKALLSKENTYKYDILPLANKDTTYIIYMVIGNLNLYIKASTVNKAIPLGEFIDLPDTYLEVDTIYFKDNLKRLSMTNSEKEILLSLYPNKENDTISLVLETLNNRQEIPIIQLNMEKKVEQHYSINLNLLKKMVLSEKESTIKLHIGYTESGKGVLGISTNEDKWHTKLIGLETRNKGLNYNF